MNTNLFKIMKHRKLERFLEMYAINARPVAMIKGNSNVYEFIWADETEKRQ
ncbi:MAG: hypothetical protein QXT94_00435 [Methanothrix sp.]